MTFFWRLMNRNQGEPPEDLLMGVCPIFAYLYLGYVFAGNGVLDSSTADREALMRKAEASLKANGEKITVPKLVMEMREIESAEPPEEFAEPPR